jgi:diaminopimelate epimerase
MVDDIDAINVKESGAKIRYGEPYGKKGSNVNFVKQLNSDCFAIRTYERGVEDETLSCGTGVTAAAIAMDYLGKNLSSAIKVKAQGGDLIVKFQKDNGTYYDIWLIGKATFVFKGDIEC